MLTRILNMVKQFNKLTLILDTTWFRGRSPQPLTTDCQCHCHELLSQWIWPLGVPAKNTSVYLLSESNYGFEPCISYMFKDVTVVEIYCVFWHRLKTSFHTFTLIVPPFFLTGMCACIWSLMPATPSARAWSTYHITSQIPSTPGDHHP